MDGVNKSRDTPRNEPCYDRKALAEAFAPAIRTQAEADAVARLIDMLAPRFRYEEEETWAHPIPSSE